MKDNLENIIKELQKIIMENNDIEPTIIPSNIINETKVNINFPSVR